MQQTAMVDQMRMVNRAFASIRSSFYSDEMCGRLLAYAALSGSEDVVLNMSLHAAIRCAQDNFGIEGGKIPDPEKLEHVFRAMRDLKHAKEREPEWWSAFAERYRIEKKLWPMRFTAFRDNSIYYENGIASVRGADNETNLRDGISRPMTGRMRKLVKFAKVMHYASNLREGDVSSVVNLRGDDVIEVPTTHINLRE